MSCKSIELGLCYDLLEISLSENPTDDAFFSDLAKIADDNGVSVDDAISLCRAHGKFLKLDT